MEERDYKGMSIEDYGKLCAYCIVNGFERCNDDFSKIVEEDECVSLLTSVVTWENHNANPELYCVSVAITAGNIGNFYCDEIQCRKCLESFDEFIEFVGKTDKLKRMYKEFYDK